MTRQSFYIALALTSLLCQTAQSQTQPTCVQPPSGMVGWWPADGNTKDIKGGNDGTVIGTVGSATGKVAQAFDFTFPVPCNEQLGYCVGNGFVQTPDSVALDLPGSLTLDAWVYLRTTGHYNIVLAKRNNLDRNYQLTILPTGGIRFENTNGFLDTAPVLGTNTWYHLTATHDGSTVRIYVNAVLVGIKSVPTAAPNSAPLTIGHDCCSYMDGLIDEVEVFDRALSGAEIQAIIAPAVLENARVPAR